MKQCYLLHFDPPYKHARHYLGYAENLDARVEHHRNGTGANLTKYASRAGVKMTVARVWDNADRKAERKLKTSKHHSRLCPLCNPKADKRGQLKGESQ